MDKIIYALVVLMLFTVSDGAAVSQNESAENAVEIVSAEESEKVDEAQRQEDVGIKYAISVFEERREELEQIKDILVRLSEEYEYIFIYEPMSNDPPNEVTISAYKDEYALMRSQCEKLYLGEKLDNEEKSIINNFAFSYEKFVPITYTATPICEVAFVVYEKNYGVSLVWSESSFDGDDCYLSLEDNWYVYRSPYLT